ncbi:MAG: hypothetical protein M3378_01795 [Actinomycetota bacterium]|nr:hypothetical protein [Actinomycetota bacterium]
MVERAVFGLLRMHGVEEGDQLLDEQGNAFRPLVHSLQQLGRYRRDSKAGGRHLHDLRWLQPV